VKRVYFNDEGDSMHTRGWFGAAVLGATALVVLLGLSARPARAAMMVTILQSGPDVVVSGSGTIDLSALTLLGGPTLAGGITPDAATVITGPSTPAVGDAEYAGVIGPSSVGSGGFAGPSSGTGMVFGVFGHFGALAVPGGYVSDTSLSGTSTYSGKTFASLGLTPGTYTYTWGTGNHADSLTVQIGPAATAAPEPASLTLLGIGGLSLLGYGWRRRRQAA
jgi:hypothetical protein